MISDNERVLNRLRFLLDAVTVVGAYFLAFLLFFYVFPEDSFLGGAFSVEVPSESYLKALIYIAPLNLLFYSLLKLYSGFRFTGRYHEAVRVFWANLFTVLSIVFIFWLFVKTYSTHFSRMFLFEFGVINTVLMIFERNILRLILHDRLKKGYDNRHILLVGYSKACEAFLDRVKENGRWGYVIDGILDNHLKEGECYKDYRVIGKLEKLPEILSQNETDEVFVTLNLKDYHQLDYVVHQCEKAGVQTKFIPDYGKLMSSQPYTEVLKGLPVIYVRRIPLDDRFNAFLKRAVDIFGALFAITLFSPVFLIVPILIKLTSKGPVIFKQERIGLHNKPFMMYKFRSMVVQEDTDEKKGWTTKNDSRVTGIGKFIRKTSIDEFPQFFNVLKGDMSLIGPRPERPQYVEKFKEEIPKYMVKHQVRPGITGWAQVNGLRGDTSIEDRIEYDIFYIENWSLSLDIKILILTFFKGFVNKNAY